MFGIAVGRCYKCQKDVWAPEKLEFRAVDRKARKPPIYHRSCFTCGVCGSTLRPDTANVWNGQVYCRTGKRRRKTKTLHLLCKTHLVIDTSDFSAVQRDGLGTPSDSSAPPTPTL